MINVSQKCCIVTALFCGDDAACLQVRTVTSREMALVALLPIGLRIDHALQQILNFTS